MGTEVRYSTFFCGVHPDNFDSKLEELEATIRRCQLQLVRLGVDNVIDSSEYTMAFEEIWEEVEDAVTLRAYIWQAKEADDLEVSF